MSKILFREARHDDLDNIWRMICELENYELNRSTFSKLFSSNIENSNVFYLVAEDENVVIGFASLHIQQLLHHNGKVGEIQELYINNNKRGKGYGGLILDTLKGIAHEKGCILLEVSCNVKRKKTHSFYEKEGMVKSHYKFTYKL
ncbi:GNAT family N-acetyltransferase [Sediminispirochaeta bajacaliforniensis]|uniref:GNAT family N-acetyltransferase n=1 Tax=Sediminispirochaeta bajacaliforniensis TaxID=148 RepID=UPI00036DBC5E|nr:GNAT family N-acetyltransferase [Sediminispirochaeta bajacaliforniensis]